MYFGQKAYGFSKWLEPFTYKGPIADLHINFRWFLKLKLATSKSLDFQCEMDFYRVIFRKIVSTRIGFKDQQLSLKLYSKAIFRVNSCKQPLHFLARRVIVRTCASLVSYRLNKRKTITTIVKVITRSHWRDTKFSVLSLYKVKSSG